jgi:disulfide bond formation protein DsbB
VVASAADRRYIIAMTTTVAGMPLERAIPLAILAVGLGSLAMAFAAQYVFGLEPCVLCLYQRVPYGVAAVLAAAALTVAAADRVRTWLVGLCAAVFLAGAALAFYHVGVEHHWWGSFAACGGKLATGLTVEDLKAQLSGGAPASKPCDQVDWTLFGVSLAGYNAIFSLVLGVACVAGVRLVRRGARS